MNEKEILTTIKTLKEASAAVDAYFQSENDYVQMIHWDVAAMQQEKSRILQEVEIVKKQLEDIRAQGRAILDKARQEAEQIIEAAGRKNADALGRLEKVKAFVTKHEKAEYLALKEGASV